MFKQIKSQPEMLESGALYEFFVETEQLIFSELQKEQIQKIKKEKAKQALLDKKSEK